MAVEIEGNVWNRANKAWRRMVDSDTVTWDFSVKDEVRATAVGTILGFYEPSAFTSTALQTAIDDAGAAGGGFVMSRPGTYTFTATVNMQPNVTLLATPGVMYTQGAAANLNPLFSFHTNTANFGAIIGGIINGNRANQTDDDNKNLVYVGDADDVTVRPEALINAPGSGVLVRDGLRPNISGISLIQNMRALGIAAVASTGGNSTNGKFDDNIFESPIGQHAVYLQWVDRCSASRNKVNGSRAVGVCSTSGTTVTWVSGENFTNITAGEFIVVNAVEYHVTAKGSSTSLTISPSAGTQSNKAFVAGAGDLINIGNCSLAKADDNSCIGGAAGHVVIHNFYGGVTGTHNSARGTKSQGSGGAGVSVVTIDTSPATFLIGTMIRETEIIEAARGNLANDARTNCGVAVVDFGTSTCLETTIEGVYAKDYSGLNYMDYAVKISGVADGTVHVGGVRGSGTLNQGINGITITPSAGWGSTATVDTIAFDGEDLSCIVHSAGSGTGANPTLTITRKALPITGTGISIAKMINNSTGAVITIIGDATGTSTKTLTAVFTPAAGTAYTAYMKL